MYPASTDLVGEVPEIAVIFDPAVTHGGRPSRAVDSLPLGPEVPCQRDGAGPHDPKQDKGQYFSYIFVIVLLINLPNNVFFSSIGTSGHLYYDYHLYLTTCNGNCPSGQGTYSRGHFEAVGWLRRRQIDHDETHLKI